MLTLLKITKLIVDIQKKIKAADTFHLLQIFRKKIRQLTHVTYMYCRYSEKIEAADTFHKSVLLYSMIVVERRPTSTNYKDSGYLSRDYILDSRQQKSWYSQAFSEILSLVSRTEKRESKK